MEIDVSKESKEFKVDTIIHKNYEEIFHKISEKVKKAKENGEAEVILDLSGIKFMDSLSLGMFVPVCLLAKRIELKRFALKNPQEGVMKSIKMLQLDKIIEVIEDED